MAAGLELVPRPTRQNELNPAEPSTRGSSLSSKVIRLSASESPQVLLEGKVCDGGRGQVSQVGDGGPGQAEGHESGGAAWACGP